MACLTIAKHGLPITAALLLLFTAPSVPNHPTTMYGFSWCWPVTVFKTCPAQQPGNARPLGSAKPQNAFHDTAVCALLSLLLTLRCLHGRQFFRLSLLFLLHHSLKPFF